MNATVTPLPLAHPGRGAVDLGPFVCPVCRVVSHERGQAVHGFCKCCRRVTAPFDAPGPKVLVVGDVGGDLEWLVEDVISYAQATGCARIMQLGDFGLIWHTETVQRQLDELDARLHAAGLTLTFLPGNHENHPLLEFLAGAAERNVDRHCVLRPTVFYTGRVSTWWWDGVRMAAVGGAPSVDRFLRVAGQSWWPAHEMLRPEEVAVAMRMGPVDILFSHDAPAGVPMDLLPDLDSTAHRAYMTEIGRALAPAYWFHGHYHESLFYEFHHVLGTATVRGLDCNHTDVDVDAMAVINLASIREGLEATGMKRGDLS